MDRSYIKIFGRRERERQDVGKDCFLERFMRRESWWWIDINKVMVKHLTEQFGESQRSGYSGFSCRK